MIKITSQLLFILPLTLGVGIAMAFQTAINSQLREHLHSPLQAALLSFLVGTIVLACMVYFQNTVLENCLKFHGFYGSVDVLGFMPSA